MLRALAAGPGGSIFRTVGEHGPTRLRKANAGCWRNDANADVFNTNVAYDWLALKARTGADTSYADTDVVAYDCTRYTVPRKVCVSTAELASAIVRVRPSQTPPPSPPLKHQNTRLPLRRRARAA